MLKNNQFNEEDFTSLKFLYNKVLSVLNNAYIEVLTDEALEKAISFVDDCYFNFNNDNYLVTH